MKSKLLLVISFFLFISLSAQKDIRIISSTQSSLTFEYSPIYSEIIKDNIEGIEYLSIPFSGSNGYSDDLVGKIFLKHRKIPVGVPSEFGSTIQVLSTQHSIINGKVSPIRGDKKITATEIKTAEDSFINQELVRFGNFGFARELPLQDVLISPVQYNIETDEITLYNKIVVRVNFGVVPPNTKEIKSSPLKNIVANYNIAKNWGRVESKLRKSNPNSVKFEGTWYKFKATEEGIYKISRSELISLGIDAASVDPRTIKIFNNGGSALSEKVLSTTPYGMIENAIYISGEDDGSFDENDYILFYG
nr:hypothetical protein [Melioribacteraceae bacterium]